MAKKERRSFSLAETIVVLAIVAVMAGSAVVAVNSLRSLILDAETRKAVSDISWARQRTVATNEGHAVVFNATTSKYSVYKSPTGNVGDFLFSGNLLNHPAYEVINYRKIGKLENADAVMLSSFWIGVYPGLTSEMIDYVCRIFSEFFEKIK